MLTFRPSSRHFALSALEDLYALSPRALPWAFTFRAFGAADSSFDTHSEALGYTVVRFADLSLGDRTLLCETPNPYAIFSLFKNLPVFICRGIALIRKV